MTNDAMTHALTDPKPVAEAFLEAFLKTFDLERATSLMSDDVVWEIMGGDWLRELLPQGGRTQGKESWVRDLLEPVLARYDVPTMKADITRVVVDGPTVVAEVMMDARTVTGREYKNAYCVVIDVAGGLITSVREYTDLRCVERVLFG